MALSELFEDQVIRELDSAYFEADFHSLSVEELANRFQCDVAGKKGLDRSLALDRVEGVGYNQIPSPQKCPPWLCCLLPMLKNTSSMVSYRRCLADASLVIRGGQEMCIDASSVVPGDLIKVKQGDIVPADCRIVSCEAKLSLTPWDADSFTLVAYNALGDSRNSFLHSTNMIYAGCTVTKNDAMCLVVQTGERTLMGTMIKRSLWPISIHIGLSEKQNLLLPL